MERSGFHLGCFFDEFSDALVSVVGYVYYSSVDEVTPAVATVHCQSKVLNDSLQESKAFAGLTELEGPGIALTLRDSGKSNGFSSIRK